MKNTVINYTTSEISGATAREKRRWEAFVQNAGVVSETKYDALVAEQSNRLPEDIRYIRMVSTMALVKLLRQGYIVNVGDVTYKPVCCGPFAGPDATFTAGVNKLEVAAFPRGELKSCLYDLKPVNLVKGPAPYLYSVLDSVTNKEWILTPGHTVFVAGRNLAPDATRPDERAWLEKADGTVAAEGAIIESKLESADVTFATWPVPGQYSFCLSTRSGMPEEYSLVTVRKTVTVTAAQTNGEG